MICSVYGRSRWSNDIKMLFISRYRKLTKKSKRQFVLESVFTSSQFTYYYSSPQAAQKEGWKRL